MSRAAENQAKQTYQTSADFGKGATARSNDLYDTLSPTYANEAANPQGFGKADLADMNTAAQQSVGGSLGAAVGQANTMGAANRNSGSFAPALDEASRGAGRTMSNISTGISADNAKLKEMQRQAGISGLQGLEGQQNSDVLSSLGLENNSTNALTDAGKSGWFQNMTGLINAVAGAGDSAAKLKTAYS
jgi:hypothetical protein